MAEQELACSQVAGPLIDQRDFGPSQAMGPIQSGVEPDQRNPVVEQAPILAGGDVIAFMAPVVAF